MRNLVSSKGILALTLLLVFSVSSTASNPDEEYKAKLIEHFDKKGVDIKPYFEDSRFALIEGITQKFTRSAEVRIESFEDYQKVLGYENKKNKIASFYSSHKNDLIKAEKEYGIPQEVIIGILGVESEFGKYEGKYNPFNAYVSMIAADHRAKFALAQLEELIEWADRNKVDVLSLKSSYAGAMSYAQFVPWSLNRWFVGDDLYHMPNNIYSVAKYLAHFKEVTGTVEKAILRYNNSTLYRQAVLSLAEEAKKVIVDS
jgi:membrane-bound lytic murein transglycosylase B